MRDFFRASIAKGREEQGRTNPLFPAKKMPRWKRFIFMSAGIGLPVSGGIFGVHALSQPQFQLSNVDIQGIACLDQSVVKKEIDAELQSRAGLFFTHASTFLFNPKRLANRLTTNLPIDSVEAKIDGNTLHVTIKEDVVMVLVHSGNDWLLADLNGNILRPLTADELPFLDAETSPSLPFGKIPKILLAETVPADLQEPIYSGARLTTLGDLDKELRALGLTPDRYMLEKRKDTWLAVSTKEKPYVIYVDLENSIESPMKILASVLAQHEEIPGMSYIDLRFGNRVYMK